MRSEVGGIPAVAGLGFRVFLLALQRVHGLSGCTDPAATNFVPTAPTDDGSCAYKCDSLKIKTGAPAGAKCFIFTGGQWPVGLTGKAVADVITVPPGERWIVQGKPTGGVKDAPAVPPLTNTRIFVIGASTGLDLRYTGLDATAATTGPPTLSDCSGRSERTCGGAVAASNAEVHITGCRISSSASYGGAVFAVESTILIERSLFSKTQGAKGGALFVKDSSLTVLGSTFDHTHSETQAGGGIWAATSRVNISTVHSRTAKLVA
jgi:hypothetical protein